MDRSELQKTLAEVHRELENAGSVDAESRALLVAVLHDIARILAQRESSAADTTDATSPSDGLPSHGLPSHGLPSAGLAGTEPASEGTEAGESTAPLPDEDSGGILGGLKKSVEHFEDTHPFLASLIGRMAEGLSNMGI